MLKSGIGAWLCALFAAGAMIAACDATKDSTFNDDDSSGTTDPGSSGTGGLGLSSGAGAGILETEPNCDDSVPNLDEDGDGWSDDMGDCNDCTWQMNPGALDYYGNNIDEDCNGTADDNPTDCDSGLAMNSADPVDGARAMDLCKMQQGESYGLISAEYVNVDGTPNSSPNFHLGHGILPQFGNVVGPQAGANLFAVSSGTARQPSDPDYQDVGGFDKGYQTGAAPGFPVESPSCPNTVFTGEAYDSIALRLRIKTPTNAKSLSFNVDFYTYEYPIYICSEFNDFVTAIMIPTPAGLSNGNISFDTLGNPLSVNAGFLEACACPSGTPPCDVGGKQFTCALGVDQLQGTGYETGAATGWLQTTAPIETPGQEITLEIGAWDAGDGVLDSTGLFDNFAFSVEETPTETAPVENPK